MVFVRFLESDAGIVDKLRYSFTMLFAFCLGMAVVGFFFGPFVVVEWGMLGISLAVLFTGIVILEWRFPDGFTSSVATLGGICDGALLSIFMGIMLFVLFVIMAVITIGYGVVSLIISLF